MSRSHTLTGSDAVLEKDFDKETAVDYPVQSNNADELNKEKHIESSRRPSSEVARSASIRSAATASAWADFEKDLEKGSVAADSVRGIRDDLEQGREPIDPADPNIVDFDGEDDPIKAVNWSRTKKWCLVATLSAMTFVTPLASSMFAPGVPQVMDDFQNFNNLLSSFVVSVYLLGYAAGPIIIAPLSELYGRQILYNTTNVLFIIFTVACAVASNYNMLIGFRFLAGLAGSAVLTLGGGTIADVFVQEERGRAMSFWSSGPLIGPVIGPIAGGFLTEAKGWRWIFWVIAITAGFLTALMFVVQEETYAPIILERKVKRLRKETGNPNLRSKLDLGLAPREAFRRAIVRPMKMLFMQPIVFLLSLYNAIVYGYLYLLFTTFTEVFENIYGFSTNVVGLTFLGIGIGMYGGLFLFGFLSDKLLERMSAKGEKKPEYRLPPMVWAAALIPIGLFIYGWTTEKHVHWFVPIFGTGWVGFGLIGTFLSIMTYLVDAFTIHAASAIAANTILRSLFGALLPLAGNSMYQKLGLGWGNSLLGFIAIALLPIPWLLYKYGERIRTSPKFQITM